MAASSASGRSSVSGRVDAFLLLGARHAVCAEVEQDPEVGLEPVALEQVEDDPRFAIELAGCDPEGVERDPAFLEGIDLGVERGDVLGSPVVGEVLEPQLLEHGRAIFGAALLAVERDDAPGDQVVASEEALGRSRRSALGRLTPRCGLQRLIAGDGRERERRKRR